MNIDPLAIALREIADTKNLLESLLLSSESFDYPKARLVLKTLKKKVRDLGRLQLELQHQQRTPSPQPSNVLVLDFKQARHPSKGAPRLH